MSELSKERGSTNARLDQLLVSADDLLNRVRSSGNDTLMGFVNAMEGVHASLDQWEETLPAMAADMDDVLAEIPPEDADGTSSATETGPTAH